MKRFIGEILYNNEKLIIIGGGGHARSIYGLLKENKLTKGLLGYSDFKKVTCL